MNRCRPMLANALLALENYLGRLACLQRLRSMVRNVQDDRRYRAWLSNLERMVNWNLRPNPPFLKGMNGLRLVHLQSAACYLCAQAV